MSRSPRKAAASEPTGPERTKYGCIDGLDERTLRGWAVDTVKIEHGASLLLVIDGKPHSAFSCTEPRSDVEKLGLPVALAGFRVALPVEALDGRPHKVGVRFRSGEGLPYWSDGVWIDGDMPVRIHNTRITGVVDGMFGSSIRGWAFREDLATGDRTGGVTIEVRSNGVRVEQITADLVRSDVGQVHQCEPHCGFLYAVPSRFRDGNAFVLEFFVMPEGIQLDNSPFFGRALIKASIDQLHGMHAKVQQLCTEIYALKDQLRQMVTSDEHTLENYMRWAVPYYECLRSRMTEERRSPRYIELLGTSMPKVSVICPAYRPDLAEFTAAVASVRNQTWSNWELLIVDDGSASAGLTALIDDLCSRDDRIRAIPHEKNAGISAATNTAIAAATGDYIALFDHDDLLVDVALELMLLTAKQTGAPVLYSDEDKIDNSGRLSEPHLKSDWNYRLALTNNYVCHLLMVEAETMRSVGPFRSEYDGAQDHDLVLRLFEAVGGDAIYHVSEVLYHWRKSANSTASQQSSKSYAVEAGRKAVLDHATRMGHAPTVTAPYNSTVFDVRWNGTAEPRAAILIPFKDQLETTRKCVDCILNATDYENYEVVLIDNWSTQPETLDWLKQVATKPRVKVIRVEERFNYSRINNIAVQSVEAEYYLFLNNDIFVHQRDWLRLMVDEALADSRVGIVGVRLMYPNHTVQHAGVVLGVGGVADHTFRFATPNDVGYAYRAVLAQDLSAVTAACMLCRADAFREVGMFDSERLSVAFNDVDLCLKVGRAGYRIVYTPAVTAEHWESLSRGSDLEQHNVERFYEENQVMMDRWGPLIGRDPFYNPHFSHETGMFEKLSSASLTLSRAPALLRDGPKVKVAPRLPLATRPDQTTPRPAADRLLTQGGATKEPLRQPKSRARGAAKLGSVTDADGSGRSRRPPRAARPA